MMPYHEQRFALLRGILQVAFSAILFAFSPALYAQTSQDYLLQTGLPAFSTQEPFRGGFVNLANGNLHFEISLGSYPQRGRSSFDIKLVYDSRIWYVADNGTSRFWNYKYFDRSGWQFATSSRLLAGSSGQANPWWATQLISCGAPNYQEVLGPYVWTEPDHTQHVFPIKVIADHGCGGGITTGAGYSLDGRGLYMFVNLNSNGSGNRTIDVRDRDGTFIPLYGYGSEFKRKDTNGNFWTVGAGTAPTPDTVGRTLWTYTNLASFPMLNSQNTRSTFTPNWVTISGTTNFGVAGVTEKSWSFSVLQSLSLPDGTAYQFKYNCDSSSGNAACGSPTGQPGYYGDLIAITLPTGGTINFTYTNFQDSNGNVNRWVTSRSSGGGQWTYAPATGCGAGCQTMTMTTPSGDQTVYTFTLNNGNGAWATTVQQFSGLSSDGTLLMTTQNDYESFATAPDFGNWAFTHPKSTTVTLPVPGGNLVKQTAFVYDSFGAYSWNGVPYTGSKGKLLSKSEYGFGNGAVGPLIRKTVLTYLDDANPSYWGYNIADRPTDIKIQDSLGNTKAESKITYDSTALTSVTGLTNHDDVNFGLSRTVRGNPTVIQRWVSGTTFLSTTLRYDTTGQVTQLTDPKNNSVTFSYVDNFFNDSTPPQNPPPAYTSATPTRAYLTQFTLPIVGAASVGYYYGTGKRAFSRDQNAADTYQHYLDSLDRLTHTYSPSTNGNRGWTLVSYTSSAVTDTYSSLNDTQPSTSCTSCLRKQSALDTLGRTIRTALLSDPSGPTYKDTTYDTTGRVQNVSNPYRNTTEPTYGLESPAYDGIGRTTRIAHADGNSVQMSFGAAVMGAGGIATQLCSTSPYGFGYPTLAVDEVGAKRQTWVDAFGRIIETDEPDSSGNLTLPTCYEYDVLDNPTRVIQGTQTRTYVYDGLSRLTSATGPETGTTSVYYTTTTGALCSGSLRAPCRATDARGITTTSTYDALNRLTSKTYSNGNPAVTYFYDQTAYNGLTITNGKGRRTGMSDGSGSAAWSYDAAGRILTERRTISGITKTISYAYNLDGSLASIAYPSGRSLTYGYNNAQRPVSAVDSANAINYATGTTYAPNGGLATVVHAQVSGGFGGITETFGFNNRFQLTSVSASSSAGTVLDLAYGYALPGGNNGGVALQTNNRDTSRTQSYTYDTLNRILTAQTQGTSGANCWGLSFGVDTLANLLSETVTKCSGFPLSLSVNSKNQITNTGFTYDLAGNMTADGSYTYAYDAENRITSAGGVAYTYDGDGLRVKKSNGTLYWRSLGGDVLAETDLSGNTLNEYLFFAGRRIARRDASGSVFYYFADHLGNTRVVTQSNGIICYEADYYPYGGEISLTNSCPQNYKFVGYERDPETGLDYALARFYNNRVGRFMSTDPVDGQPNDAQSWNAYAYVVNDPMNLTDPSGLDPDYTLWLQYLSGVGVLGFGFSGISGSGGAFGWMGPGPGLPPIIFLCPGGCVTNPAALQALLAQQAEIARQMANIPECSTVSPCDVEALLGHVATAPPLQLWFGSSSSDTHYTASTDFSPPSFGSWEYAQAVLGRAGNLSQIGLNYAMVVTAPNYIAMGGIVLEGAVATDGWLFGTRIGGNKPLLNSADDLRIGWSYIRDGGRHVFRIGGRWVGRIKKNPHINLWPPSWWLR